jgi:hypothetical protein
MKSIINFFKRIFRKPNTEKLDEIISKIDMNAWYGSPGDEVYYYDQILQIPILTIKLSTNDIKFFLSDVKKEFFDNVGFYKFNKAERIYLYDKIETHMVTVDKARLRELKSNLLYQLGLREEEFSFLVKNCRDYRD